jgi:spore germination cell wall hydrolase CwlJ-like protein
LNAPLENKYTEIKQVSLPKIDAKQIACMAKNIYYEAGHESIAGLRQNVSMYSLA